MDCAAASGALCCNDLLEVVAGACSVEVAPLLSLLVLWNFYAFLRRPDCMACCMPTMPAPTRNPIMTSRMQQGQSAKFLLADVRQLC